MARWTTIFEMPSTVLILCFIASILIVTTDAHRCQSCFAGCRSFDDCDCGNPEEDVVEDDGAAAIDQTDNYCEAPYCYAKLESFTDEGVSAIQKGCLNEISTSFLGGCQYASDDRSIACYCSGDYCNSARNLSSYEAPLLPVIECCECNEDESGNELCHPNNCTRNCTGNFCYLDMVANAQGCGWGHPQLFHFLRTQKYQRWNRRDADTNDDQDQERRRKNGLTCAEYYDNYRNYMHGCTCSSDMCNVVEDLEQLATRRRDLIEQKRTHLCHSLHAQSETAFDRSVYRHASVCPSEFCFLSWTSVEVVINEEGGGGDQPRTTEPEYVDYEELGSGEEDNSYYRERRRESTSPKGVLPRLRSNYEISAGCLIVDDREKVQVGCTVEWSRHEQTPLTKHCVCADKLCNDFHLIEGDHRLPFRAGSFSSHAPDPMTTPTPGDPWRMTTTMGDKDSSIEENSPRVADSIEHSGVPRGDGDQAGETSDDGNYGNDQSPDRDRSTSDSLVPVTSAFVTSGFADDQQQSSHDSPSPAQGGDTRSSPSSSAAITKSSSSNWVVYLCTWMILFVGLS